MALVRLFALWLLQVLADPVSQDYKAYADFKKDLRSAGAGATNFTSFDQAWKKYQQFSQYLSKEGSHSPVGFHRFLSDYQHYMDFSKYMAKGVEHQKDSDTHFKDFLDFQKFLSYRRGGEPGVPQQFAHFQADAPMMLVGKGDTAQGASSGFGGFAGQFVPADTTEGGPKGGLSGVTGDFKHYMDYSKYMNMFHKYTQKDWMSEWQKFQNQSSQQQNVPYNAKDCKTVEELEQWKEKQTGIAKQWIPDDYQGPTLQSIEQEYKQNLERIKHPKAAEPAPVVAAVALPMPRATLRPSAQGARAAQSVPELVAWRGRMASLVESLPEKEQREWDRVFDGEMKAAFQRFKKPEEEPLEPTVLAAAPRSGVLELSRTMLVFVVSFSVPVAGMYVYRAVQGRRGTDLDAAFLSLGEP